MNRPERKLLALTLAISLSLGVAHAAETFDLGNDVSAYQRFLIYPHLQRAFAASRQGDRQRAIEEFARARAIAPRNARMALYLVEAYQQAGMLARAAQVMAEQRRYSPADPRFQPRPAHDCGSASSPACRLARGWQALREGRLDVANAQLGDPALDTSDAGLVFRRALAQRAIHLHDWPLADALFARLDAEHKLGAEEREQWFRILLTQNQVEAAGALWGPTGPQTPDLQLTYAFALRRADATALAAYLSGKRPVFTAAADERQWLMLLAHASRANRDLIGAYVPRFASNRALQAQLALPAAQARGDQAALSGLLAALPPGSYPELRLSVSLWRGDATQALHWARSTATGSAALEANSYRLASAGMHQEAVQLLLGAYPFPADGYRDSLLQRLAQLAAQRPDAFLPADRERLRTPLPDPRLRSAQARIFAQLHDCQAVVAVLGDLDPSYTAQDWRELAECHRTDDPVLAQRAYAQAFQRDHDVGSLRALAFQAAANKDYPASLAAWQTVADGYAAAFDPLAAADVALAANAPARARTWLKDPAHRANLLNDDRYWWLLAQAEADHTPVAAREALRRALQLRPNASYYAQLAQWLEADGDHAQATSALMQAARLSPGDANLQAALGYAYQRSGDPASALGYFEAAYRDGKGDRSLSEPLVYVSQQLGDRQRIGRYTEAAIDDLQSHENNADAAERVYGLRRLHENLGRRWVFSFDATLGDKAGGVGNDTAPGTAYRSYMQIEADYRLSSDHAADVERFVAYARIFSGSGETGSFLPDRDTTLGTGLRWKPFRDKVLYLAAETQFALGSNTRRHTDLMLRASTTLLGNGRHNDDWHPQGNGWWSQRLYLDFAHYVRAEQSVATLDYRFGHHFKIGDGQTLQPYFRAQYTGILDRDSGDAHYRRDVRGGIGLAWNLWSDQTRYDAYRNKITLELEYQHPFDSYLKEDDRMMLYLGMRL